MGCGASTQPAVQQKYSEPPGEDTTKKSALPVVQAATEPSAGKTASTSPKDACDRKNETESSAPSDVPPAKIRQLAPEQGAQESTWATKVAPLKTDEEPVRRRSSVALKPRVSSSYTPALEINQFAQFDNIVLLHASRSSRCSGQLPSLHVAWRRSTRNISRCLHWRKH